MNSIQKWSPNSPPAHTRFSLDCTAQSVLSCRENNQENPVGRAIFLRDIEVFSTCSLLSEGTDEQHQRVVTIVIGCGRLSVISCRWRTFTGEYENVAGHSRDFPHVKVFYCRYAKISWTAILV